MENDVPVLTIEDYFSQQILENECSRYTVLLATWIFLLAYLLLIQFFRIVFLRQGIEGSGLRPYDAHLLILLALVIMHTINIRRLTRKWRLRHKKMVPVLQYLNAFIEQTIPSVAMILIAQGVDMIVALNSPAVFVFFIFIVLSILELDFYLSIFYGIVASIEYLAIVFYYLNRMEPTLPTTLLTFPFIYVSKALILLICGVIAGLAAQQIRGRTLQAHNASLERQRIETLFGQQISPQVVEELIVSGQQKLSRIRQVCIMFLDLRGFARYCEGRPPEEIVRFQNSVLSFMIDTVNRHGGIINQILGDGFMATFGAPLSTGHDCRYAVTAALEIIAQLKAKIGSGELPLTDVGIGLHFGAAVTGNVGTDTRKQYSITGNVVILASRIEQLNKQFGSRLLISREVLERIEVEHVTVQPLGLVEVKGRSEPMELFKLA